MIRFCMISMWCGIEVDVVIFLMNYGNERTGKGGKDWQAVDV